jgi:hypothetical protein
MQKLLGLSTEKTMEFINHLYRGISEKELQCTAETLKKMEQNLLQEFGGGNNE